MGAYLSEPVTTKVSSDENNDQFDCGASSMQGWRVNQEDAHNTILNYDDSMSFFAVYDGHGGAEVATYCSQKLPDFIKNTESYRSGNIEKALEDAFLGFDDTIATEEVMALLKEMAGEANPTTIGEENDDSENDDENVRNLFQEAELPLQEVLAKYENKLALHRFKGVSAENSTPMSPFLRAKRNEAETGSGDGCSSGAGSSSMGASSSSVDVEETPGPSSSGLEKAEDEDVSSSTALDADKESNGEVSTTEANEIKTDEVKKSETSSIPDSSEDKDNQPQPSDVDKKTSSVRCNGEVTESVKVDEDDISSSQNGNAKTKSGKAKDKTIGVTSSDAQDKPDSKKKKVNLRRAAAAIYNNLLKDSSEDEDTSDSNDETFQGAESNSSDDENINGVSDSESNADEEGEEEDEDSSDDEYDEDISKCEEPGADSGCTAVVALIKDNEIFVANAGDSRCIVCREGKAVDMSIDHKPEDLPEMERILKAGGKVTSDGRINGGLNLSRAIGDHSYKQNKTLNSREQMITALPDIKRLTIDPDKDEFMVLACDGIWNFMSSQDVCDFIRPRLAEGREKLSQICEEMFDHCLAPSTIGDGTGCDNMTAIIVKFKNNTQPPAATKDDITTTTENTNKRPAEDDVQENDSKRQRVEDTLSCSVVTSSV